MGVVIRQSFKGAFVGYIGAVLGGVTTIFVLPYFLSPELIGLNRILFDFSFLFAFFSQFGITNAIVKFHHYFDEPGKRKILIRFLFIVPLFGFGLITLLFFSLQSSIVGFYVKKSKQFIDYFYLVFPYALFMIYLGVFEVYATTLNRITVPKLIREIVIRVLTVAVVLVFFYFHLEVSWLLILTVGVYGIAAVMNIFYSLRLTEFEKSVYQNSTWSNQIYKQIFVYMSFMFLAGLGSNIIVRTDTLMISSMLGLDKTGIYSISFFMATIVEIPSKATLMISGPIISRDIKEMNYGNIENLYKKNALNQSIISGLLLILIWVNVDNIFGIMPKGGLYSEGKYVLLIITLAKFYDSVTGVNNLIVVYSKYYKMALIYVFIMAIVIIAGNYYLIPILGITGAALSSFAGYFFINTISIIFIYSKFKIQPFVWKNLLVTIPYILCFVADYLIPVIQNPYLDAILRSASMVLIFLVFIYQSNISPELTQLALKFLKIKELINFLKGK